MPNETMQAILDAALPVFAKSGFSAARISDIADAAGVGKGTVYLYFPSKEDLLIGVLEAYADKMLDLMSELFTEEGSPEQQIRHFFHAAYRLLATNADLITIIEQRPFLTNKKLRGRAEMMFRNMIERLIHKITASMEPIQAAPFDLEIIATAAIGIFTSFPMYRILHPEEPEEALIERVSSEMSRFFCAAFLSEKGC